MKWIPKDIETYLNAKEYVDTAVVPLYSVSVGGEMKQSAANAEFITLLTSHLERQFTGRILLFPPFTYLKNGDNEKVMSDLLKWERDISDSECKHIFYITSELDWRTHEQKLGGSLIWLPSLPLEQMNDSQKMEMIDSQVKQLLILFTQKWHENE
ncbi:YpiF family protein [Neobacillus sp. MM2021_6]|uniref:YpiF family protein n=1 Tax=Bacillaceae TaxID=186817 RepID=UPI00140A04EB|nr:MULTISPECIES: YpiF family protein [Bacillaceae]MBO0958164.1 YpiF family protein [Neobacillus sp. MM2021_6]NHC18500.1 YpiF family protein [Bacillus sp. MM2020_4]